MNARETRTMMRTETARAASSGRAVPRRRASVTHRLLAYVADWLVGVIIAALLVTIGGLQLYLVSDRGSTDAPDGAVYAFLAISLLALPLWLLLTYLGWSISGQSLGKLGVGLRIVRRDGARPGPLRSLARLAVFVLEHAALLIGPVVLGLWLVMGDALPVWGAPLAGGLLLLGLASLLPAALARGGRPLHDLAAGTTVVEA
jgi:uncharacterized RDD family membrane protein YckC